MLLTAAVLTDAGQNAAAPTNVGARVRCGVAGAELALAVRAQQTTRDRRRVRTSNDGVLRCRATTARRGIVKQRMNLASLAPGAYKAMIALETYLASCSIEVKLVHLLKLRASQMNGCAFCIDMHWKDLRASGETEQRLYGLDAWEESPYYSDRERAALRWIEAITFVADGHVADAELEAVTQQFSEQEVADLTVVATAINAWNRIAIASRTPAGSYEPRSHAR